MKTRLFFVSLLLSLTTLSFAQQNDAPGYKTPYQAGKFGDNWFIQLGAGVQTAFADKNHDGPDLQDRLTLAPTFAIGKWFNPFFGFRIKGDGGSLHHFQNDGAYMIHDQYYAAHVNFMWNMASYYGKYNPKRVFGFIPYLGLGFIHRFENDQVAPVGGPFVPAPNFSQSYDGLTWNGGIMMTFRLSNHVDFHVDFGGILAEDEMNRILDGSNYDFILSATGGFTFKLGKTDFDVVQGMDYAMINDLNNRINSLRAENDELSKRPVSCPKCPEVKPATVVENVTGAPTVVNFRIGSAKVDANQQINIYNTASFMKNSSEKIKVVGYADKNTGTSAYNMKLSEERAKAVAKELTSKYNIPSQNIIIEWKGSDVQPYSENNWNRVVIMKVQE